MIAAIDQVLDRAGAAPAAVDGFTHGMTVGTNALLEEHGRGPPWSRPAASPTCSRSAARTAPSLYHPCRGRPRPLVDRDLRFEAAERIGSAGVIEELADEEVDGLVERLRASGPKSIAVCLLFAFSDPSHERRVASALRDALPDVHVSASHEVLPPSANTSGSRPP